MSNSKPGDLVNFQLHDFGPRGQEQAPEVQEAAAKLALFHDFSGSMGTPELEVKFPLRGKPINVFQPTESAAEILAAAAITNPEAIEFMAQLLGVQPCPSCNFVHNHCKCNVPNDA